MCYHRRTVLTITPPSTARTRARPFLRPLWRVTLAVAAVLAVLPIPGQAAGDGSRPGVVLGVGDSVAFGVGAESPAPPGGYLERLQGLLETGVVRNHGIPGATSVDLLAQLDGFLAAERPELTIIMIGINDAIRGIDPQRTVNNIAAAANKATAHGSRVLLCTTTPVKPNERREQYQRLARLNPMIVSLANARGYPLLDFWRIFHSRPGWHLELMDPASPNHPDAAGYALMAQSAYDLITSRGLLEVDGRTEGVPRSGAPSEGRR